MNEILKFEPIFKSVIWGGRRIAEFKGMPPQGDHIGESWELSPMPGHESVISQGSLKGETLPAAIAAHGADIMGERLYSRFGGKFPLLVKLIDSADDLSVQVHPDDALGAKRHNSLGKTEMWYSVAPAEGAYLYAGFSRKLDVAEYRRQVAENEIIPSLRKYFTKPADVFFLPAGRVHSIGRGNFVLEIQEASDITYRIYDYDRRDAEGNPRQLHVEESVDAIDFDDTADVPVPNVRPEAGRTSMLADCAYFTTEVSGIDGCTVFDLSKRDSFTILVATEGELELRSEGGSVGLRQGETALVPASVARLEICGKGAVVSTYIK